MLFLGANMLRQSVVPARSILLKQQCMKVSTKAYSKSLAGALASSVYHRELADGSLLVSRVPQTNTADAQPNSTSTTLPPPIKPIVEKKFHLTAADKEAMRTLRAQDPVHWTQKRLAEKFGCSRLFVALTAPCPDAQRQVLTKKVEETREGHGYKRRLIGLNRQRRRQLW
ncbi:mitochondrial ribosomal protein subunit L20-domain-containing protein [Syncephalis fuscata]|nr:mitochondrial ribosomal protein subunit L20-domain-containing protein [Syncephalis fuscata]